MRIKQTSSTKHNTDSRPDPRDGFEKLAFGSVADAVRLIFTGPDESPAFGRMDLFNISEIKRGRDGSMEIKFYDRIRALQCLEAMQSGGDGQPLLQAIREGAKALADQSDGA